MTLHPVFEALRRASQDAISQQVLKGKAPANPRLALLLWARRKKR